MTGAHSLVTVAIEVTVSELTNLFRDLPMKRSPAQHSSASRQAAGYWTSVNSTGDGRRPGARAGEGSAGKPRQAGNGPDEFPEKSPDSEELWEFPW